MNKDNIIRGSAYRCRHHGGGEVIVFAPRMAKALDVYIADFEVIGPAWIEDLGAAIMGVENHEPTERD